MTLPPSASRLRKNAAKPTFRSKIANTARETLGYTVFKDMGVGLEHAVRSSARARLLAVAGALVAIGLATLSAADQANADVCSTGSTPQVLSGVDLRTKPAGFVSCRKARAVVATQRVTLQGDGSTATGRVAGGAGIERASIGTRKVASNRRVMLGGLSSNLSGAKARYQRGLFAITSTARNASLFSSRDTRRIEAGAPTVV